MRPSKEAVWWLGQLVSLLAGGLMSMESSVAYGFVVWVALGFIVDLRRELNELNERKT